MRFIGGKPPKKDHIARVGTGKILDNTTSNTAKILARLTHIHLKYLGALYHLDTHVYDGYCTINDAHVLLMLLG